MRIHLELLLRCPFFSPDVWARHRPAGLRRSQTTDARCAHQWEEHGCSQRTWPGRHRLNQDCERWTNCRVACFVRQPGWRISVCWMWRSGRIIQRFQADQTFWSWVFYNNVAQVAYHVGPTHGEDTSHCELHDIEGGRRLASWDGDLDDANRPPWTRGLDH